MSMRRLTKDVLLEFVDVSNLQNLRLTYRQIVIASSYELLIFNQAKI